MILLLVRRFLSDGVQCLTHMQQVFNRYVYALCRYNIWAERPESFSSMLYKCQYWYFEYFAGYFQPYSTSRAYLWFKFFASRRMWVWPPRRRRSFINGSQCAIADCERDGMGIDITLFKFELGHNLTATILSARPRAERLRFPAGRLGWHCLWHSPSRPRT